MTEKEFKDKYATLLSRFEKQVYNLRREYSLSINPYKVGDIIEDHIGKGRILAIVPGWDSFYDRPQIRFYCENLTKKGEINKREPERNIYFTNLKKRDYERD